MDANVCTKMRLGNRDQRINFRLSAPEKRLVEAVAQLEEIPITTLLNTLVKKYAKDRHNIKVTDFIDKAYEKYGVIPGVPVSTTEHLTALQQLSNENNRLVKQNRHLVEQLEQLKPFVNVPITYRTYD